jgi:hypothetical protein
VEPERISIAIDVPDHLMTIRAPYGRELRVGIMRFEDKRRQSSVLGVRIGRWGSLDACTFILKGTTLGDEMTRAFSKYLRKGGWQPLMVQHADSSWPEIIVSVEIVTMKLLASSAWFSTKWTSEITLLLEGRMQTIGSRFTAKLNSARSRRVFWFHSEDAAFIVSESLSDVFDQGLSQIVLHVDAQHEEMHRSAYNSSTQ